MVLLRRRPAYAYAFFSSTSAHFTASSGFMPLMAWAYMSTRMYLTRVSDPLGRGAPGTPGQRPKLYKSLKGARFGSRSHIWGVSQKGDGPTTYPSFATNHLSYCGRSMN